MRRWLHRIDLGFALALAVALLAGATSARAATLGWTLVGWNDLGMHCMDDDYSVFSILPPYNVIHAQLVDPSGALVRSAAGITVTYEAVGDPDGSFNSTSAGKTDFWTHVGSLFGVALAPDQGLAGFDMPGAGNAARAMRFDAGPAWFSAEGIPITPIDDAGHRNDYPLMRLTARDASGHVLATTDVVLPVSSEMDCRTCHASGAGDAARPASGWANDPVPSRDYRLNILLLHDERRTDVATYQGFLQAAGYDARGLHATASGGKSVLCAACHSSNALPGVTAQDAGALTHVVHATHATVMDPVSGIALGAATNRSACYRCHPGSTTKCLRGAMGKAVASDGTLAMQCQSCHGGMAAVGAATRRGWLEQPTCQNCHTGTAAQNSGQIRYASAFDAAGHPRAAADATFATTPNQPASGLSLFRFSHGHGGLACEACHGSTHAEVESAERNDNLQNVALQGHAGALGECNACHVSVPTLVSGGPHGMHPVGASWVRDHADAAEHGGTSTCRSCHGLDSRGTVLSEALGDRTLSTHFGNKVFFRGARIGCYACHNGPGSEKATSNRPAVAADASASTGIGVPIAITLSASDPNGNALSYRIISQARHGTVGLVGNAARYFPDAGFQGSDSFTWAAWDGSIDSNLATARIDVSNNPPVTLAPVVTSVRIVKTPFTLTIVGANFDPALTVTIGGGAWSQFSVLGPTSVRLVGNKALKTLFPKGVFVPIRLTNPDGKSVTIAFDRKTKRWR